MLTAGAAGCGRSPAPPAGILPGRAGGYERGEIEPIAADQAAEPLRRLGVARLLRATYRGAGEIVLTAHEMTSEAGAFEALQRRRPAPGSLAFQAGKLFLVAESEQAGHAELQSFAAAVERALR